MELLIVWLFLVAVVILLTLSLFLAFIALFGPPYVPTPHKTVNEILKELNLRSGMIFYDLGCGDGRVVRSAVKDYGVRGIGIDLNLFLIFYCRLVSKLQKLSETFFFTKSFFKINLSKADIIYMYPIPVVIPKLVKKFKGECKKGAMVVSYCFEIKEWRGKLVEETIINRKPVFFYRI